MRWAPWWACSACGPTRACASRATPAVEAAAEPRPAARLGTIRLLREDPHYASYLGWQFLLGVSNMMIEPALVYAVSREMGANYGTSVALVVVVPTLLSVGTLPLWAGWVDRMHAAEFRAKHSWLWVVSQAVMGIGTLLGSVFWIGFGRVVFGIARGGGNLAWSLGHNDFAHPERAGLYMGVHATLTGLRGVFAPFLGMLLYLGADARALPGGMVLPGAARARWLDDDPRRGPRAGGHARLRSPPAPDRARTREAVTPASRALATSPARSRARS